VTTQFPDEVRYRGRRYAVTAVDGAGLFEPSAHGVTPGPLSTACWRGFRCWYAVHGGRLRLRRVEVGRPQDRRAAVRLFGVKPQLTDRRQPHAGAWDYRRLDVPVPFSGRLLVGAGYVDVGRIGMGFLPAWTYRRVLELTFTAGRCVAARNRSVELAVVRERLGDDGLGPARGESNHAWITRTFSLSFDYSWPSPARDTSTPRG
jgi:hypothetical protein